MNSTPTSKTALLSLAMGAFGIALTEFVIMGILPKVAEALGTTIPQAGHFISAYALGVVIGAPVLTRAIAKWPARRALLLLMLWFTVFNTLSGFSWNYQSMLVIRFLSGLPHGAFFGIGAVIASRLVREGREAQGIASMFAGFTVANVVGVPLGTYIGNTMHWGVSFYMVGFVGLLTLIGLWLWIPKGSNSGKSNAAAASGKGMHSRELWGLLALTAIGTGGFFAWYSYIAPLLMDISGHTATTVSFAMILAGVGMVGGNILGAKMVGWFRPIRAIAIGMSGITVLLLVNAALAAYPGWSLFMCFAIGAITFTLAAPIQVAIIEASGGSAMLASSFNQSAFNVANALGAYLAGLPIAFGYSVVYSGVVGAGLAGIGALIATGIWLSKRYTARGNQ
jgi:DHA1 family arabinose polymer transporter-like MFS transporter